MKIQYEQTGGHCNQYAKTKAELDKINERNKKWLEMVKSGITKTEIAKEYGVSVSCVYVATEKLRKEERSRR